MALWGKADSTLSTGTVTVDYANKTITGSGTSFTSAKVGSVISIGVGNTFGEAVISGITSDTVISIATTQYLSGQPISGVSYLISQKPVYVLEDSNYSVGSQSSANAIYGVDEKEAEVAHTTKYEVTHSGWVGIHTYMCDGELRVKSEVLVAMSGISTGTPNYVDAGTATQDQFENAAGDAGDDTVYPDV